MIAARAPRALVALGARTVLFVSVMHALFASACITDRILVADPDHPGALTADPAQFKRVERQTSARRHLPFLTDVPADVMTVEQLRAWFDTYADERKASLEREDRFYHRTNILPPTVSTAEAYKGFLADFVGGVYDDGSKHMILVSDYAWWAKLQQDFVGYVTGIDWAYEVFLAHELDHALQDQHFGLGDMLKGGVYDDNDDAAFVRKTLLETEANVVGMSDFLGMDLDQLATRKSFFLFMRYNNLLNGPLLLAMSGKTPSFFAKQSFSQYELGLSFVETKLDEGGFDELSRAYVRIPGTKGGLPASTEQLLWPKKMRPESLDQPIPIARLESAPASLPKSKLVITNVFGALAFKHFFERYVGPLVGNAVADGWGGDRWDIVDDAGASVLVWRTTWDSDDDAREFVDAYAAAVPARYGERAQASVTNEALRTFAIPASPDEKHHVATTRDEQVWIERRGKDVLVVEGTTAGETDALVAEMWTKLVRGAPPLVDEKRLDDKRAELERHIGAAEPKPERPDLVGRLFLPARTMSLRMGIGLGVDENVTGAPNALIGSGLFLVNDTELRWGFRPHFELALPLALSGEVRSAAGQTVATVAVRGLFPSPKFSLGVGQAVPIGDDFAIVGQASIDDFGFDDSSRSERVAGGLLVRPFHALVVAPSIARTIGATPTITIGSALRRGSTSQPLVELEVVEGLYVYENSTFLFDVAPKLELTTHTHVVGLLMYF